MEVRTSAPGADASIDDEAKVDHTLTGWQGWLFAGIAVAFSVFHLYTAFFGSLPHMQQRAAHGLFGAVLAGLSLAYAMLGHLIPGTWGHAGFNATRMTSRPFMADSGLWGMLPGLSATVISIFILFGLIMMGTGGGRAFMNAALVIDGRQVGGAAKVATVGSSLMGTISGSGMANAAATGSLTILPGPAC